MYMEYGKEWRLCSNICILFGMLLLRWAILSNWVMTFCLMVKRRHWTKKVENHCIRVPDRSMNNLSTASHPESLCCWCAGLRIHLKQEVVLDYFGWHEPWEYFWISSGYVWRFESIKVCRLTEPTWIWCTTSQAKVILVSLGLYTIRGPEGV